MSNIGDIKLPVGSIAAVMITVDRTSRGKTDYLLKTLDNLQRSGFFQDPALRSFYACDSGSPDSWIGFRYLRAAEVQVSYAPVGGRLACQNAGHALILGGLSGAPWVLFMEDDLDFCADFLGSVGRFLDKYGHDERYRLFAFGAAYDQISQAVRNGDDCWPYPIDAFYGTQCFAIRAADAVSLGNYISSNPPISTINNPDAYDLMFHAWAKNLYPGNCFLASAPSFVQHIGRQSICTGKDETHRFESWPGREWTYQPKRVVELAV